MGEKILLMAAQMVLKLLEPFFKDLLGLAIKKAEDWANRKEKETGKKPTGEEKMNVAVSEVLSKTSKIDGETARILLQARHGKEQKERKRNRGKTAGAKRGGSLVLLLIGGTLLFASISIVSAQEWHDANQATVGWDAVTKLADGRSIPADNTVEYAVYLSDSVLDPEKANPLLVKDNIVLLLCLITFGPEGRFFVGIEAIRKLADGTEVKRSSISWSDDPTVIREGEETFGFVFYASPARPGGIHRQ